MELKGFFQLGFYQTIGPVPNAPCGVESCKLEEVGLLLLPFLMHRVELKGGTTTTFSTPSTVFLMHRVELKGL